MDTTESSAPNAHPSTEEPPPHGQAERPHACIEGWVFVGYVDEHGEEREASYRCRRCADSRRPGGGAAAISGTPALEA